MYLNNELEGASCIGIATDNSNDVDIADAHIKERAATYLPHWTGAQILGLHNVGAKRIHHITSETIETTPHLTCLI